MLTEPVNWCVSVSWLPNLLEPVMYSVEAVTYCTLRVCAVMVPVNSALEAVTSCLTKKLSAEDAVSAFLDQEEVATNEAVKVFSAQLAVPNREPVIEGASREPVTCRPLVKRPDPLTSKLKEAVRVLIPTELPVTTKVEEPTRSRVAAGYEPEVIIRPYVVEFPPGVKFIPLLNCPG
jgi:hypothetical protein